MSILDWFFKKTHQHQYIDTKEVSLFSYMVIAMGDLLDDFSTPNLMDLMRQLIKMIPNSHRRHYDLDEHSLFTIIEKEYQENRHFVSVKEKQDTLMLALKERDNNLQALITSQRDIEKNISKLTQEISNLKLALKGNWHAITAEHLTIAKNDRKALQKKILKNYQKTNKRDEIKDKYNEKVYDVQNMIDPMLYCIQLQYCKECGHFLDPRDELGKLLSNLWQGLRQAKLNETSGKFAI